MFEQELIYHDLHNQRTDGSKTVNWWDQMLLSQKM